MPAVASNTIITVDMETSQGVIKTASKKGRIIACTETVAKTSPLIKVDDIRSDPNPLPPVRGTIDVAGDITMCHNLKSAPFFLDLLTNTETASTGVGPYVRTGAMTGGVLKTFMMEKAYTDITVPQREVFCGLAVKSMAVSFGASGLSKHKYSVVGMNANAIGATVYDGSAEDWQPGNKFHDGMLSISIGGAPVAYVLSGSLTVTRNIFTDDRPVGSAGALASLPGGMADISGTLVCRLVDLAVLTAIRSQTGTPIVLTWTYSAAPAYNLVLTVPAAYFDYSTPKKSKDGLLDLSATFMGGYDTGATNAFSWSVANDIAGDTEY
jgi:hypothetical protein